MKRILLFTAIIFTLASCASTKVSKTKETVYKQENKNVKKYFTEYKHNKITLSDLETLVLGSLEYVEYFVAPVK